MSEELLYDPDDYPTGGPRSIKKDTIKIGSTVVTEDVFIIDAKKSGTKQCPSLDKLKKLSKYYNSLALKKYNNYIRTIL